MTQRLSGLFTTFNSIFPINGHNFHNLTSLDMSTILDEHVLVELLKLNPLQDVYCYGKMSLLQCFHDHSHIKSVYLTTKDVISVQMILQLWINRPKLVYSGVYAHDFHNSWSRKNAGLLLRNKLTHAEIGSDWLPLLEIVKSITRKNVLLRSELLCRVCCERENFFRPTPVGFLK